MPASDAIRRRANPITITRPGEGTRVNGIWQPGTPIAIPTTAVIQPLSGKERALLPEGMRDTGRWRVWSLAELKTNDELTIEGTTCVLLTAEKWTDHYRAVAGDADAST